MVTMHMTTKSNLITKTIQWYQFIFNRHIFYTSVGAAHREGKCSLGNPCHTAAWEPRVTQRSAGPVSAFSRPIISTPVKHTYCCMRTRGNSEACWAGFTTLPHCCMTWEPRVEHPCQHTHCCMRTKGDSEACWAGFCTFPSHHLHLLSLYHIPDYEQLTCSQS